MPRYQSRLQLRKHDLKRADAVADRRPNTDAQGGGRFTGAKGPGQRRTNMTDVVLSGMAIIALVFIPAFGTLAAATFTMASLTLLLLRAHELGGRLLALWPLFLLPLLAIISTAWSDAPPLTMRGGLELLITFLAAVVVASQCDARTSIALLFTGFFLVCLLSLPDAPQAIRLGTPMRGIFASKNLLGYNAQYLELFALAVMFDSKRPTWVRATCLPALAVAWLQVYLSRSAGAQINAVLTLVIYISLLQLGRLQIGARAVLVVTISVIFAASIAFNTILMTALSSLRGSLGKDATLTGRTDLWSLADQVASQSPWLGRGFNSFWRLGNLDAEAMWRKFGILNRTGFNFHNGYIEMNVDLGMIGAGLLIGTCVVISMIGLVRLVQQPTLPNCVFLTINASIYLRELSEAGFISPFGAITALWLVAATYTLRNQNLPAAVARKGGNPIQSRRIDLTRGRSVQQRTSV